MSLAPGTPCRVVSGAFATLSGTVIAVDGADCRLELLIFGRVTQVVVPLAAVEVEGPVPPPDPDQPFQPGDRVFVHDGVHRGGLATVERQLVTDRACNVALADGRSAACRYEELSLVAPRRRPPEADWLAAIGSTAKRRGLALRERLWWAERARERRWARADLPELRAAGEAEEARLAAENAAEVERLRADLLAAMADLSDADRHALWQREHARWVGWRDALDATWEEVVAALTTADERRDLADAAAAAPRHDWMDEATARERAVRDHVEAILQAGTDLRRRCERDAERAARDGRFAWDDAPIPADAAPPAPPAPAARPPAPPAAPPFRLPDRAAALAALAGDAGGEPWWGALARLATDGDEAAVTALRERHAALVAEEDARAGFDVAGYYRLADLELALLATGAAAAVEAVVAHQVGRAILPYEPEVVGVKLRGRSAIRWADDPWGVGPAAGDDVERVWGPLAGVAPALVGAVTGRTLALVLLASPDRPEPRLGYVFLWPHDEYERRKRGAEHPAPERTDPGTLGWLGHGVLGLLVGEPPQRLGPDARAPGIPAFRLPSSLRALYGVHAGLVGLTTVAGPGHLASVLPWALEEDDVERFEERNAAPPERFVAVVHDGAGNCDVYDRDRLGNDGEPVLVDWDHETWEVGSAPSTLWERCATLLGGDAS